MSREQVWNEVSWCVEAVIGIVLVAIIWPINLLVSLCQEDGSVVIELCGSRAMLLLGGACICAVLGIVCGFLGAWLSVGIALGGYLVCGCSSFYYSIQDGQMF